MVLIHIAGYAGSGKTTLMRKMKKIFEKCCKFIDTDKFIPIAEAVGNRKHGPTITEKWIESFNDSIVQQTLDANQAAHDQNLSLALFGTNGFDCTIMGDKYAYINADICLWYNTSCIKSMKQCLLRQHKFFMKNTDSCLSALSKMSDMDTHRYLHDNYTPAGYKEKWYPLYDIYVNQRNYKPCNETQIKKLFMSLRKKKEGFE